MSKYKAGQKLKASVPFSNPHTTTIHKKAVMPSFHYSDKTIIIYSCYGKHKRWWHEFLCDEDEMNHYVEMAKKFEDRNKNNRREA